MELIRLVRLEDKQRLFDLVRVMLGDSNPDEVAAQVVDDFYNNDQYKVFIIEVENRVAGFGVLKFNSFEGGDGIAELVWLGIDSNFKRKGLGGKLVEYIEHYARTNGIRKVYLKTSVNNKVAVCFWIMQSYKFEARLLDFGQMGLDDYYLGKDM